MKQFIVSILAFFLLSSGHLAAQEVPSRHLVRLGWGDCLFEALAFHPASGTSAYNYSGHYFADYRYSLTRVISVGVQADFQSVCWTEENGHRLRNYDLSLMPCVRFTWLHTPWVRLYSGLGGGMLYAFDNSGGKDFVPVFDVNPVGIQLGKTRWCGSLDLGFMTAVKDIQNIYMAGSRLVSVSVNYCW